MGTTREQRNHVAEAAGIGAIIGGAAANIADAAIFYGVVLLIAPLCLYRANRSRRPQKDMES
ncbi:hypothetical protein TH25_17175 [Thalassospira profundimaris]|uniref:Uncharacterized protein n=1 Tax=Thalassospira profundimaris TaxID=502049 RepID=A0A367WZ05_9PROT|nr:hypothetical protein TH25_17175 [Thalassospira profundimaris]